MTPERWRRITEVFHAARARDAASRGTLLEEACAGDPALRAEVDAMLAAHRDAEQFGTGLPLTPPYSDGCGKVDEPHHQEDVLRIGENVAHYTVTARLGIGGMGVVYRATDTKLQRDVALKVLPAAVLSDTTARERLLREARTASRLNHPHICTVHDVGEANSLAYIAMECVEGQSLSEVIGQRRLPLPVALRYGMQVSDALTHAHERDIVHRDLKCANVLITPDGRAKVVDFGLARHMPDAGPDDGTRSDSSLTAPGTIAGTLAYMAPEQLRGQRADRRSDVWSLGVMLHEMFAGGRPFVGRTAFELSSAILEQSPPPLPDTVPPELRAVVERCLAKDPAQRYQRGGEVLAALRLIESGGAAPLARTPPTRPRSRWPALAAMLAVMAALAITIDLGGSRSRLTRGTAAPRIRAIAVLPLDNLSADAGQDVIADGIHAALITDLAKLGGFERVTARRSVARYKKSDKTLPQIAKELGVDAVMTGSFLRAGNHVQVAAQLVDAATEGTLWAGRYEREVRDVLKLQNEILASMTHEIQLQLSPQSRARLSTARTVDPEAYELALRGRALVNQLTPEGIKAGLQYLQQATEKDPSDPMSHAGLAIAYSLVGHSADPQAFAKARAAAQRALKLDGSLAEVHEALAIASLYRAWDWTAAEGSFRRALELDPNLADARAHYGWYHQLMGRKQDGIAEQSRSVRLDPLNPVFTSWLGAMYWDAEQYDEAIAEAQKSLELNPSFPWGHYVLGGVYARQGRFDEAIAHHRKMAAVSADGKWVLGLTYALAGRDSEARSLAAELEKNPSSKAALGLSLIYAELGEEAAAFRWLNVMVDLRDAWGPWLSVPGGQWRSLDSLRGDPRFKAVLRRMNLPSDGSPSGGA